MAAARTFVFQCSVLVLCAALPAVLTATTPRPNVLFISIDDLRPEIGAYMVRDEYPSWLNPYIQTPHLDALASRSVLLRHAYVQQALCSPSRVSVLTGRRPDTTKVLDLDTDFRHVGSGNFLTIPQYFKDHGYVSLGAGKIFHYPFVDPVSWSEPFFTPPSLATWSSYDYSWIAVEPEVRKQSPLPDEEVVEESIKNLNRFAPGGDLEGENFFIAVGIHKPHLPFVFPREYLDLYPMDTVKLPDPDTAPMYMPGIAWDPYPELRLFGDMHKYGASGKINTTLPDHVVLALRRAYYAAVSYADDMVGLVLAELAELDFQDNTIVVVWSDHGFELGELGAWCKHDNFELSTRAPLMISKPGLTDGGMVLDKLTEFVDLFPSLVDLAGLPKVGLCPVDSSLISLCTEGLSILPLLTSDPENVQWKERVFMQYPHDTLAADGHTKIEVMGYSMRTEKYRYTEWVGYDAGKHAPIWAEVYAVELYDHEVDPKETHNLAEDPDVTGLPLEELSKHLHAGWRGALPP